MIKQITYYGDSAIICSFGDEVKKEINKKVNLFFKIIYQNILEKKMRGIKNCIPSYNKLIIYFDLNNTSREKIVSFVENLSSQNPDLKQSFKHWSIPVCYDQEFGIDQKRVSEYTKLSIEEVIQEHIQTEFYIYMLGFAPGFPYMGDLDNKLYCPRLPTPRVKINQGSVIIAENFSAIYPYDSPGGWNILGNTPVRLFDQDLSSPSLFSPGDTVKFYPISLEEHKNFNMKTFLKNEN